MASDQVLIWLGWTCLGAAVGVLVSGWIRKQGRDK